MLTLKKRRQRGIGLLELMLSISIIAILLVMATRYYMSTKQSQQESDAVSQVMGIVSGGANYALGNNNSYSNMSLLALVQGGYVPGSFCGSGSGSSCGSDASPWHTSLSVAAGSANSNYVITIAAIPATNVCTTTAALVNNSIQNTQLGGTSSNAVCSGNSLVVTVY